MKSLTANKTKIIILAIVLALLGLLVKVVSDQQETRQQASSVTALYFTPTTTNSSPLVKTVGDTFSMSLMVDPGTEYVSFIKFSLTYDPAKLSIVNTSAIDINEDNFAVNLEGPYLDAGKVDGVVSVGSDPTRAIYTNPVEVAVITFKALAATTNPTVISHNDNSIVLSIGSNATASQNVLSQKTPAYIDIDPVAPTSTIQPSATSKPGPTVNLNANPTTISTGQNSTLTWTSTNADNCTASGQFNGWRGGKNTSGNQNVGPFPTSGVYTLTLTCTNATGTGSDSVDINVVNPSLSPSPGSAPTVNLTANPTTILTGNSVGLTWTSNNANTCVASGNFSNWSGNKETAGTQNVGVFNIPGNYTLNITCTNQFGSATDSVVIIVTIPPPTATTIPSGTVFNLTLYLHGLGNSGDNPNPTNTSLSNKDPLHKTRPVVLELINSKNEPVATRSSFVTYASASGNFKGMIDVGTSIPAGDYTIKVKSDQYLRNAFPGIQKVPPTSPVTLPDISMVTGDVLTDNKLNILDYNILYGCYKTDLFPIPRSCTGNQNVMADLNDESNVNIYDINLFIRELSVQAGL